MFTKINTVFLVFIFLGFLTIRNSDGQVLDWQTDFEKSKGQETPRYEETIRYCKQLAYNSDEIRYQSFGTSPQGRELPLLIFNTDKQFTPEEVKASGKLVVLVQAAIHAGEPDGKDAGLMLFRDYFIHGIEKEKLKNLCILFIPIFNVDGHERWGKYNRINQRGPIETGFRATAQNLNLNRDYLKADAPEMRDWLKMFHSWFPDFLIDSHTTNGGDYQYPITYHMEIYGNMDEKLTQWQRDDFIPSMERYMEEKEMPTFPYVQYRNWHNPLSGLRTGVGSPNTSTGYVALLNRPGLLIETHMLKPYPVRVEATYQMIKFSLDYLSERSKTLQSLLSAADKSSVNRSFRRYPLPVKYKTSYSDSVMVNFKGIDFDAVKSDLTDKDWFKYGRNKKDFQLAFFNTSVPEVRINLPEAYFIPPEWEEVIARLRWHGIELFQIEDATFQLFESYEFVDFNWDTKPFESRIRLRINEVEPIEENRFLPSGSFLIPVEQHRVKLIAHLLEPMAESPLVSWGFFNSIFEQKEYAELYVMEPKALEMIQDNPKLLEEFEQFKTDNPHLIDNQYALMNWFYQKTPYYDRLINMYPVLKLKRIKKYGSRPQLYSF